MENNFSLSDMSALMNGNGCKNNSWDNPFMYLIWYALFRNGGFGNNSADAAANIDINAKLNQLAQQIQDNQSTNSILGTTQGNHEFLHGLANSLNMGFAGTNASINQASMTNMIGQKDAQAQMSNCCCDIKSNILNQTNQLQSQIAQLANGVSQGFAQVGFLTQQQTNELNTNANYNTQRILDKMCSDTTQALRDKVFEMSQTAQTASIVSQLKTT